MVRLKLNKTSEGFESNYIFGNKDIYSAKILTKIEHIECLIIDSKSEIVYNNTFSTVKAAKKALKLELVKLGVNFEQERRKYKI